MIVDLKDFENIRNIYGDENVKIFSYQVKTESGTPINKYEAGILLNDNTFNKYIGKLDKSMQKKGFRKINDPNVQYRAYTNGNIVIDDVAPGNVGVDLFGQPKLIDFNMQSVPEWLEQGFILKNGGKFNFNRF